MATAPRLKLIPIAMLAFPPRSASGNEEMEKRSRRRIRDLVARPASLGLSENEIGRARISMMARNTNVPFKGRIQKRKTYHLQIITFRLQRAAGPYSCANYRPEQVQQVAPLLDHLVGDGEHAWRNCEVERFGGPEVNHELELGGLYHRQIGGLRALKNSADIDAGLAIALHGARAIAQQATGLGKFATEVERRHRMARRISDDPGCRYNKERIRHH